MINNNSTKQSKGLYVPQMESDACGVGMLVDLTNKPNFYITSSALTMLENMEHRGACGCEENTGDGAGILTQLPHLLFYNVFSQLDLELPAEGKYGVGMFFLPKDEAAKEICLEVIKACAAKSNFEILNNRVVPVNNSELGKSAVASEPNIQQIFFKSRGVINGDLEKRFYFLRNQIMKKVYFLNPELVDDFYISSLSSKTIVYKGLLTACQLRNYYPDLQDSNFQTALAIVHSRFSTNTIPKWKLAQPFRCIAHNGEINTIQGNLNWWNAREKYIEFIDKETKEYSQVFPVCDPYISDSGNLDNVIDFLKTTGRSIPHCMMMLIPEAWQNDMIMSEEKRAFYQYHESMMESWDGPASICFTDGTLIGACLDRNGLRPSRYLVTSNNLLVLGSETGCIDIDPTTIVKKGRLEPGKMLLVDLDAHAIISDDQLKATLISQQPYKKWIDENATTLEALPHRDLKFTQSDIKQIQRQVAVGMSKEDEKLILNSMVNTSKEAIGSMGADIPLAVLSKSAQHIGNYFKQQFAQVTNPAIDSIREKHYMSLSTTIGGGSKILNVGEEESDFVVCEKPILTEQELKNILHHHNPFSTIDLCNVVGVNIVQAIDELCEKVFRQIQLGIKCIHLTDRLMSAKKIAIPSLLAVGALHHFLIEKGLRKEVTLIADVADVWETHHIALLFSYGIDLVCPYLAHDVVKKLATKNKLSPEQGLAAYNKALQKGLLKIMSKLGISTLASYKGAQTFEALGLDEELVYKCFKGTVTRIGGMRFSDIQREASIKHKKAFESEVSSLEELGVYQWRKKGEYHLFNPKTIHLLQHSTKINDYEVYKKFTEEIDRLENNASTLRSFVRIKKGKGIPLDQVESVESIFKRFASGAMSFGSISHEAHTTLAMAMNRIGGKSNSGEGGEDPRRNEKLENGDWQRSAIKQVASGRFGVNIHYLSNAEEIQIKIAQGAKPGEGGQLPGHKVDKNIAAVRNSTPGVGLISPPPHHDIYSIEDLAQLIFDLKNANGKARISVKLVSKSGVGVIASGVVKAHADHILISGFDGGTGASPLSSIRHAGLPWEIGLAETHQTLMKNGLRDRVVLQADGQIRTGRDLAVATMLGAEEWGVATAALVVEGCILMRKCHLNTCPVGIATQNKDLRKKFDGKVEHLVNYFHFLANHLRTIMASLGIAKVDDLVGRTDLLEIKGLDEHWKTKNLQLETLFHQEYHPANKTMYCSREQDHGLDDLLDYTLLAKSEIALENKKSYSTILPIKSTDRAVGAILSNEISERFGLEGLKKDSLSFEFKGSAGQSFGAFAARGIQFNLQGEANDYFGKGLSGGTLILRKDPRLKYDSYKNTIVGNVALYGATSGEAFINGLAGDRFAVRNSGAHCVVEGIGDNGCEYMTGGRVVILGNIGRNFGAGMSGGLAYLFDVQSEQKEIINQEMIDLDPLSIEDLIELRRLIRSHANYTGSKLAFDILNDWEEQTKKFTKVFPKEYKKVLRTEKSLLAFTKSA